MSRESGEAWGEGFVDLAYHGLGRRPIDTAVCDGDAVLELVFRYREGLGAGVDVALNHRAHDRGVARGDLGEEFAHDVGLAIRLFGGVFVRAIYENGLREI